MSVTINLHCGRIFRAPWIIAIIPDAASNVDETMSIATDASDEELFVVLDTPDGTTPFDDVFNDQLQGRLW